MKWVLSFLVLTTMWLASAVPASAQNIMCPDRPPGDSTNACANTRFVASAAGGVGGVVTPEQFGAACGTGTDSTAAFQAAVDFLAIGGAGPTGGTIMLSSCLYKITTPIIFTANSGGTEIKGVSNLTGAGSEIYFVPTIANQCAFQMNLGGGGILSHIVLENFNIRTPASVIQRHGVCAEDVSEFHLKDVNIWGFNGGTTLNISGAVASPVNEIRLTTTTNPSLAFNQDDAVTVADLLGTGGLPDAANHAYRVTIVDSSHVDLKGSIFTGTYSSGGTIINLSTALRIAGREFFTTNNVILRGDLPLRFSKDTTAPITAGTDVSNISNVNLVAPLASSAGTPVATTCIVLVDDNVVLGNMKFSGTQAWAGGKSGFCWNGNATAGTTAINQQVAIDNMRTEQKSASGGWSIDVAPSNIIYNFHITNFMGANDRNFIRARNVANLQIDNAQMLGVIAAGAPFSCLDINATVQLTQINNSYWIPGQGNTATLTGQTQVIGDTPIPTGGAACLPAFAVYSNLATNRPQVNGLKIPGTSTGVGTFIAPAALGAAQYTLPTGTGTLALTSDATGGGIGTVDTVTIATNANFFPTFVAASTNSRQVVNIDSVAGITYNPSTNNLQLANNGVYSFGLGTAGSFIQGAQSGNTINIQSIVTNINNGIGVLFSPFLTANTAGPYAMYGRRMTVTNAVGVNSTVHYGDFVIMDNAITGGSTIGNSIGYAIGQRLAAGDAGANVISNMIAFQIPASAIGGFTGGNILSITNSTGFQIGNQGLVCATAGVTCGTVIGFQILAQTNVDGTVIAFQNQDTLDATSTTAAANVMSGGLGVVKSLWVGGSIQNGAPVTKTASFTLATTENYVVVNNGASTTVTLPAASSWTGRGVLIKTIQAFAVISASSNVLPRTDSVAGTAILPATDGAWAYLVSDGTNWVTMSGS